MRRRYEALVILDLGIGDEAINKLIEKIENLINSSEGSELIKTDRWGKKRLAYEINKKQFGYYVLFEFFSDTSLPKEFDRMCRLDPEIMRNMIIVIPEAVIKLKEREEEQKSSEANRRNSHDDDEGMDTDSEDDADEESQEDENIETDKEQEA